ncbi:MAG: putative box helicase domain protein [Candidatus Saccharibacteria bacterium]|nr:putative box helicase domain protein [Candidatus Saccharibacteria bacterium]
MPYNSRTARKPRAYSSRPVRGNKGRKKDYIDPRKFIKAAKPLADVVVYQPVNTFADFAVDDLIKKNLEKKGIAVPSPIQDQAIPLGLEGKDIIGIANTGTGKTIAFALPVLQKLMDDKSSRAIIMAPTRELATQIEDEFRAIAKGSGLFGALLIGGAAMGPQLRELSAKPQIIIGTPGRIKDHMERGSLKLDDASIVVLDEVDRMLDMGFIHDMRTILSEVPAERQSFFFSATMDGEVARLIQTFTHDPVTVSVKTGDTSDNVEQDIVAYQTNQDKIDQLHHILTKTEGMKALVFDDTQRSVERLSNELLSRGFKADAIHGGKSQGQRQRALNRFKKNDILILVATDVAARGIDVSDITHVINYSTPQTYSDYVHRIGRAGRAGRAGQALTFVEA